MFTKTTEIDQITSDKFKNIMWREVTTIFENGVQISQKYHRSSSSGENKASPGAALDSMPAEVQVFARSAWTPENIAPVTAQVVEAIAVQQAAITEAAAKKAEAEAAAAKEIEDAKARETAANEAKALAEAAEAAAKEAQAKADAALKAAQDAANALAAQEKAAAEKAAFDKAVAAKVAEMTAEVANRSTNESGILI